MARTKLKKLLQVKNFNNVFNLKDEGVKLKVKQFFNSQNFFTLEIGCGHGDYSIELAKLFPDRNFIGIDVKGARVFLGALKALDAKLDNVAFIIGKAEKLAELFKPGSIQEIYIPFPDPHIRRTSQNRRLISPSLLKIYKELLNESGLIHFKTDNYNLYEDTLKLISDFGCKVQFSTKNLYGSSEIAFPISINTTFEKHYIKQGRNIAYICFEF